MTINQCGILPHVTNCRRLEVLEWGKRGSIAADPGALVYMKEMTENILALPSTDVAGPRFCHPLGR
jgi:hypothetical protein